MKLILSTICLFVLSSMFCQSIPSARLTDWSLAGNKVSNNYPIIKMQNNGVIGDGITPNDSILYQALSFMIGSGAILEFPNGQFLFNQPILLPSNVIISGQGPNNTIFKHNLNGSGDAFIIKGKPTNISSILSQSIVKNDTIINVNNGALFSPGEWIQLFKNDSNLVTSSWALNSVGQIIEIKNVIGNQIITRSPIRLDYLLSELPYIQKIAPIKNVGIECLKVERIDNTAPQQSSNIKFEFAVNSWVNNLESENCTFSHVALTRSSNISIENSYFHHAFDYGPNGRAYGVMIQFTSNECLVQNNVFENLRHSMILQAGANANVFSYNYSFNPFWTSTPSNSAGDMVLHGNYPYLNLFEQNQGQNIVIDNSHGPNGPFNTFFRNRASLYGIFFSASNSPNQNIIGNEITNNGFPYSFVNYTLQGIGHFIYGNNNKGIISPSGTSILPIKSLIYNQQPSFIKNTIQWGGIGTPNSPSSNIIPAYSSYINNALFSSSCGIYTSFIENNLQKNDIIVYPNPSHGIVYVESEVGINEIQLLDQFGKVIYHRNKISKKTPISIYLNNFNSGKYLLKFMNEQGRLGTKKILLINE